MNPVITFTVPGKPMAQPRQRISTFKVGERMHARAYLPDTHPVNAYKAAIALAASMAGLGIPDGPVEVSILAGFPRLKSQTKKRSFNPPLPHAKKPDIDNVAKAVLDALPFDDRLVARLVVEKWIVAGGCVPFTEIKVREL